MVIHRDLKAGNLLLNEEGVIKLGRWERDGWVGGGGMVGWVGEGWMGGWGRDRWVVGGGMDEWVVGLGKG